MKIVKAKWLNDADSPVVLMVDDLNNLWFDINRNGHPGLGEDWGFWRDLPGSSFAYLRNNLLNRYPKVKVTFFTVVGNPIICKSKLGKEYKGAINENIKSIEFFRSIQHSNNFEIAFHGLHHGIVRNRDYVHEWSSFSTLEEALGNIEQGQDICKQIFGKRLKGGKYPGYTSNIYSDDSIDKAGFSWWCREWTYRKFINSGNDYSVFEMRSFGDNNVIDFPSTVSPSIIRNNVVLRCGRMILRRHYPSLESHLEALLRNNKVISIQEHSGAIRGDGMRQTPNIVDTMPILQNTFSFLAGKNVWHATCSEIANYHIAFTYTHIKTICVDSFSLTYSGRAERPWLTLVINKKKPIDIISPSGKSNRSSKHHSRDNYSVVNIEVENGLYQIR